MYMITPAMAVGKLEVIKTDDGTFEPRLTSLDREDKYRARELSSILISGNVTGMVQIIIIP